MKTSRKTYKFSKKGYLISNGYGTYTRTLIHTTMLRDRKTAPEECVEHWKIRTKLRRIHEFHLRSDF